MAIETRSRDICGHVYECSQFPARAGLRMQGRVMALLGPLIGGAGSLVGGNAAAALAGAFAGLAKVEPDEFAALAFDLLQQTQRDGKLLSTALFDAEFAGNYGELFEAIAFALETNFDSLFGRSGISGLAARFAKLVEHDLTQGSPPRHSSGA